MEDIPRFKYTCRTCEHEWLGTGNEELLSIKCPECKETGADFNQLHTLTLYGNSEPANMEELLAGIKVSRPESIPDCWHPRGLVAYV